MRRVGLAVTALFMTASALAGQGTGIEKGTFEFGAFGRYNRPTTAYTVTSTKSGLLGIGGRIGLFVARNLAVELDGSSNAFNVTPSGSLVSCLPATSVSCPVQYTPIHLQLVYNAPVSSRFFLLVGGGVSDQHLSKSIQNSTFGVGGTAGLRWRASRAFSFRLDGSLDVLPKGTFNVMNTYYGGQFGVDFLAGGRACDHASDVITIRPTSVNIQPRETATFSATAAYCGGADAVVYRLFGVGTLDTLTGRYTATVPGTARVVGYGRKGKVTAVANVTVPAPAPIPPPPPPPRPTPPTTTPPPPPPTQAPVPAPTLPQAPAPPPVTSIAIAGASRVRAGARTVYRAQLRLANGTPVTRAVTWSVTSGTATVDSLGGVVTTGSGVVVVQAKSGNATATHSVTSYDWLPFGDGSTIGVALESYNLVTNQSGQSGFPTLLIGCGSGTVVVGVVTQGAFAASGSVSYRFDGGAVTADTWLTTLWGVRGFSYVQGGNATRRLFANRIAASQAFVFGYNELSGDVQAAAFAVTGMTSAIAPSLAACPVAGPTNTGAAINALLSAWRQAPRR